MKKRKNKLRVKNKIIMCFLIMVIMGLTGCSNKEKIPTGDYVTQNKDGTQGIITIGKDQITFSNIDIEELTTEYSNRCAFHKKTEIQLEGDKVSDDEFDKLVEEAKGSMDLDTLIQNQSMEFTQEYDKENQYVIGSLFIEEGKEMEFSYDCITEELFFYGMIYVKN